MKPTKLYLAIIWAGLNAVAARAIDVPTQVKGAVAYIYGYQSQTNSYPMGTAFLVGIPSRSDSNAVFEYLVSAKHVFRDVTNGWLSSVGVRLNMRAGGSSVLPLPVVASGSAKNVFVHADANVDIAVVPFAPDFSQFDYKFIPGEMLTSKKDFSDLNIKEGTEIFFTGLFATHPGTKRITPMFRFGRMSLITDEPLETPSGATEVYLVEAAAYPGNSGSPVYFFLPPPRNVFGPPDVIKLAGIMAGYFIDQSPVVRPQEISTTYTTRPSLGISLVTPAYKLREILWSDELKKQRGE